MLIFVPGLMNIGSDSWEETNNYASFPPHLLWLVSVLMADAGEGGHVWNCSSTNMSVSDCSTMKVVSRRRLLS